ncbi:MAG TPA: transposase [Candidatus Acidoferrales bacterium]|nr:transposase [Candidatus Acidoferrales bacterium]
MREEPLLPRRRSVRLPFFDYSTPKSYFLTICAPHKRRFFGEVIDNVVQLNGVGRIVDACWREIPSHFVGVELGPHVVMPNHVHGIVRLTLPPDGQPTAKQAFRAQHAVPLRATSARRFGAMARNSIPAIVRSFKSAASTRIRDLPGRLNMVVWQRGFHEHVIRDEEDYGNACEYIRMNPGRWQFDEDNS